MPAVTKEFVEKLPEIYRDILAAFPEIEPARKAGEGLAFQTIFEWLRQTPEGEHLKEYVDADRQRSWSLGEIIEACENMAKAGAVEIKQRIFVCPTPVGEQMILLLTGKKAGEHHVPAFPSLRS